MTEREREKIPQQDKRQMKSNKKKDGIDFIHQEIEKVNLDTIFPHLLCLCKIINPACRQ